MKKLFFFVSAAVALVMVGCSNNDVMTDWAVAQKEGAISFGYNLPNSASRTSLNANTGFPDGAVMAVDAFQTDASGELTRLFLDDKVTYNAGSNLWTYSPLRYWDIASTYKFYAMYPWTVAHEFDAETRYYKISDFVVANVKADQVDVMIAEEKKAMPENLVTFNFNHLLSNVNFNFKIGADFDLDGIKDIELTGFDLYGVKNQGSYQQTGSNPTNKNVIGTWTVAPTSADYNFPELTRAFLETKPVKVQANYSDVANIENDLLLLPQSLAGAKAYVSYRINYNNGTASSFSTTVNMATALGRKAGTTDPLEVINTWKPNYIYNYFFAVNPSKVTITDFRIDDNGTIGGDAVPVDGHTLVVDGDGNWWVDTNGDGVGDDPIVWEDVDGDGKEEAGVDKDGDGHIDNVDGENLNPDNNPIVSDGDDVNNPNGSDVILVDTDGDGVCDTQLERDVTITPGNPENYPLDWDGSLGGDGYTDHHATLHKDPNKDNTYYLTVDLDGDGVEETTYACVWEDLDGDGKKELGVDRDGDGHIDNVDGENLNLADPDTEADTHESVSDGDTQANPNGGDVILIDTDGDGRAETQIEWTYNVTPDPDHNMVIKFSATIEDWQEEVDANVKVEQK